MDTQDIVETWRQQAIQEGIVRSLVHIYESRFGTMPGELRAVIEDTHDEATLYAWLKLAGTRGADEVSAAIMAWTKADPILSRSRASGCRAQPLARSIDGSCKLGRRRSGSGYAT